VAALFAQDQVELSRHLQVIGGLRFDRFDLAYHNHRNGDALGRVDHLVSPRAGVVYKPVAPLSLYGSYSVSYLPSAGDQFASLTAITQQVEPESFNNYETGAKWDVRGLALTAALYRLDRTNTRSTDPSDPTRIVQTGSQRTNGIEVGLNGQVRPRSRCSSRLRHLRPRGTQPSDPGGSHPSMQTHRDPRSERDRQGHRSLHQATKNPSAQVPTP